MAGFLQSVGNFAKELAMTPTQWLGIDQNFQRFIWLRIGNGKNFTKITDHENYEKFCEHFLLWKIKRKKTIWN